MEKETGEGDKMAKGTYQLECEAYAMMGREDQEAEEIRAEAASADDYTSERYASEIADLENADYAQEAYEAELEEEFWTFPNELCADGGAR
jgi:hypothetical protein